MNRRTNHIAFSGKNQPPATGTLRGVFSLVALLIVFALAFVGLAHASGPGNDPANLLGPVAQATAPGDFPTIPIPLGTGQVPQPEASVGVPGTNNNNPGTGGTTTTGGGGDFPWLIVVIVLLVVVLGAVAAVMMRSRRPVAVAEGRLAPPPGPGSATRPMAAPPTAPVSSATPAAPVVTSAATAAAGAAGAAAMPNTLTCPNCQTVNGWNENFCHNCGQDLRPVRASVVASMAPPVDQVTDDMPYLETLDRADEQLEYVLSRRRVVIGSAAGCDIMVDSAFAGAASVAPRHAQLTRNDDGSFSVADLGAPTGTFVNDARVDANGSAPLTDGAQIRVGSVRFVYRVPS